jgi:uncharacterized protein (DUF1015 family)
LKTQGEKSKKLIAKSTSVYQKSTEKQNRMKRKGALLAQNKSRWYKNK